MATPEKLQKDVISSTKWQEQAQEEKNDQQSVEVIGDSSPFLGGAEAPPNWIQAPLNFERFEFFSLLYMLFF